MFLILSRTLLKVTMLSSVLYAAALLLGAVDAKADWSAGWTPTDPYIAVSNTTLTFSYTYNSSTGAGTFTMCEGGTSCISNPSTISDVLYLPTGTENIVKGSAPGPEGFFLTANFSYGVFIGGSMSIDGVAQLNGGGNDPNYSSGVLIKSNDLFYSGFIGSGSSGYFQFEGDQLTGDIPLQTGNTRVFIQTGILQDMNFTSGAPSGTWTTTTLWEQSFSGTADVLVWTPIPGSIVLLGGGLAVLLGLKRSRVWLRHLHHF